MVAITIGGLGFQSSAIKTTTKIQALLAQLQKSILRSPPAAATAATAAAAGCRNISSWTRIEIPSVEFVKAHATAGRSISAPAMLHIQEQLTTPPGGGGGGGAICSGSGATAADTTGRRIWPTAAPLLEIVLRKVVQNKKNKQNNRHPTTTTTTTTTTLDSAVSSSSSSSSSSNKKPIVLELGAGCGLIGMGLASYSGQFQRIIMTDTTTEWLERNVAHNRQQQQSQFVLDYSCCPMEVLALEWGRQRDHEFLRQKLTIMAANEEEERGFDDDDDGHDDSNKDNNNNNSNSNKSISSDAAHFSGDNSGGGRRRRQSFFLDYIVGSDLLYNPASHSDLISTLNEFASSSSSSSSSSRKTEVLLAYPKRADNEAAFSALAQQRGFEVTISPLLVGRGGVNNNNNNNNNNHHQAEYSLMTLMKQTIK